MALPPGPADRLFYGIHYQRSERQFSKKASLCKQWVEKIRWLA